MHSPLKGNFPITQMFGENPELYHRFGLSGHNGVDYGCPIGTPVCAAQAGQVRVVHCDDAGYGLYIILAHADGLETLYAHLSQTEVQAGTAVAPGEQIGASGSTGFSTGPHLHFEVRQNGQAVDPLPRLELRRQALFAAIVTAEALNVRSGPGLEHAVLGLLHAGDEVQVSGIAGGLVWAEIGAGKWCALRRDGQEYLELLPSNEAGHA